MSKPDGGPAFPGGISATAKASDDAVPTQKGMSLRAWLAGMAMQAIIANPEAVGGTESAAIYSTKYADALIAELEKEKPL